jgi:hypothetical protein
LSLDGGKTWSCPAPTPIIGQPWPIPLGGSDFAVVVVDRNVSRSIKLYETRDLGKTWSKEFLIFEQKQKWQASGSFNEQLVEQSCWSYGLPSGIRIADNTILLTWYAGDSRTTDIHWCRINTQK